ncbi:hypothetical protein [Stenotrophomonas lactitubi]|uniref:hypothetical protein n=1 Tax=Stenotrophomonas lactitubi TaxID=2045214 RepID=UPI001DC8D2A9|nr:hypothetical protein [Stenotrophomonas lactitubi]CAH0269272.1 hypothetical protein SRABI122_03609 [Stenotrophomonas lactitubi]CAH0276084.1 hypothetical protein SRABI81_03852 [Stenotrophomonas lactitubi]CAH0280656.1 hypothetical protein SRABI102_03825 [Stenotrophomonas lactitubi]CAH0282604.1 hypothetical protein SRABI66_04058 [Stenotrophomonas lactitubi]
MRPLAIATLALLMAAPALAKQPPSAYLERQHSVGKAEVKTTDKDAGKERCRVVREWKVGEVIAQHRICDDPPKPDATDRERTPPQR